VALGRCFPLNGIEETVTGFGKLLKSLLDGQVWVGHK
jgi:hypothetical protein